MLIERKNPDSRGVKGAYAKKDAAATSKAKEKINDWLHNWLQPATYTSLLLCHTHTYTHTQAFLQLLILFSSFP